MPHGRGVSYQYKIRQ